MWMEVDSLRSDSALSLAYTHSEDNNGRSSVRKLDSKMKVLGSRILFDYRSCCVLFKRRC